MSAAGKVASLIKPFVARNKPGVDVPSASCSSAAFAGSVMRNGFRPMFARLFEQQLDIVPGGQTEQPDLVGQILGHFDGAGADRAGAAEQNNVLHDGNMESECAADTDTSGAH